MRRVANGEKSAFEVLYLRYAPRVQGFFVRMLRRDYEKAQDFTQELFLKVYKSRNNYEKGIEFSSWIFSMAYNMCKNEYRHQSVVEEHESFLVVDPVLSEGPLFEK